MNTTSEIDASFKNFLKSYQESNLKKHPVEATFAGDRRFNDKFPNTLSESHRDASKAFYNGILEELHSYDKAALNEVHLMSYEILESDTRARLCATQSLRG